MKIDNLVKSTGSVAEEPKTRSARGSSLSSLSSNGTKVEISSFSEHLQKLEQLVAQTPVVDSGKVDEIKQAISQGQFQVNPEKVADGLIDSVRQMLSSQPRTT